MKFGFIIDNRKCIGCHACTTACKAEHNVPVGVNRTWVKQVEKGEFPHTRRLFSVMRCNHCTDAPCVEICPVEALFIRDDGIVDFDNRRCIGCKSCMQACPYDALYINPQNSTAAKCNYCAHRVDIGLEPACVNVCPEHAIISGDMEDADSEISQLLGRNQVTVRKAAKGTNPNLFYIDGDEASLNPMATSRSDSYFWNSQARGVGHFAKAAEKMAFTNDDVVETVMKAREEHASGKELAQKGVAKSIDVLLGQARRIYDGPDKGILWGWEVSAYVLTKAIAAGVFLLPVVGELLGKKHPGGNFTWFVLGTALLFLGLTGLFLVKDLDRPDRFLNVILRPQWNSWLVRGGYGISIYGALLTLLGVAKLFGWTGLMPPLHILAGISAIFVAVYTAYLFAQAKGRDFWQSPMLALHMLVHSLMAGAAVFTIFATFMESPAEWMQYVKYVLIGSIVVNLVIMFIELTTTHPTVEAKETVKMILKGKYKAQFWGGTLFFGNILPLVILAFAGLDVGMLAAAGVISLIGIYITEHIWVEAPQRIQLN